MRKVLIFGNSASGKSTLAKELVETDKLAHLDLDILACLPTDPPERTPLDVAKGKILEFTHQNNSWVIEGCYTDLLEMASSEASEIIFMNLSVSQCIENAKLRPWEPHKYKSKEEQDRNLSMLIEWIKNYRERKDCFSHSSHQNFYDQFEGKKSIFTSNCKNT